MKKILSLLSVFLGASAYTLMITMTIKGTGEGLSFVTFFLWAVLAWISGSIMKKKGFDPSVPFIYGIGATATTIVLLIKGRYGWTGFDTITGSLVGVCIVYLFSKNERLAFIFSIIAACVTPIPFIAMTWQSPELSPILPNVGFTVANLFMFLSGKTWKLEDWLYSAANFLICFFGLMLPWLLWRF